MARSRTSNRWLKEHFADEYVKRAQAEGYRSRAVYKLLEIQERDKLLRPGMTVVDLGAAPGGWAQAAASIVGDQGKIVALDLLPIDALAGVESIQGDFRDESVVRQLFDVLEGRAVDLVLSDMAPNSSGMRAVDQPRQMYLAELALDFARQALSSGGGMLVKVFQGEGFDALLKDFRASFGSVVSRKPKASRARSSELYLLARNYRA
ncbi:23S rRNA (uridine(2552)-2'-O)-methyltransferase RlmE [Plasticicumulans acidivorans]|uniref:Ribosomal RNA large subunit methyltransferase E n=1 Tax=Plasticicumulans acidivorans TaxID=886464 RepID=A0A317MRV5_9GAMM|nr:23S rRNA (uridine(2552)-2'-O)-methyltransferase RlmE [Plasticicumulans acidivorans]PWV59237.1 23S rRNA Um-2552 2'-O-methyltransferase [Plasticicumulans acidivorans]